MGLRQKLALGEVETLNTEEVRWAATGQMGETRPWVPSNRVLVLQESLPFIHLF